MATNRFTNYVVMLQAETAQGINEVYVEGIQDASLNAGLQTLLESGDGIPYNTFGSLSAGAPTGSFTTFDLKTFLDECGPAGMLIDSGTYPGVVMYWSQYAQGATRTANATATHASATFTNGILVPRTLTLAHGASATLSADIVANRDAGGDVDPLAVDGTAALPTLTPNIDALWTLGKVVLNATTLAELTNVTVDFGINLLVDGSDGEIYPTIVSIENIQPSITVTTRDLAVLDTLTHEGAYYTSTQVVFYAKSKAEGGTVEADATTSHIKFTLGKTRVEVVDISGQPKEMTIRLTPWYTNSGSPVSPITIDTASAIT